jgi:hypothetical protein
LPQRTTHLGNFILFDQFAFPPDWNAIILVRKSASARWMSDHSTNVSCRRKRHHAPAGEEAMPNLNVNGRNISVKAAIRRRLPPADFV